MLGEENVVFHDASYILDMKVPKYLVLKFQPKVNGKIRPTQQPDSMVVKISTNSKSDDLSATFL